VTSTIATKLLTPEVVADQLGLTLHTLAVWRCAKRMPLPYVKLGGRVRYRAADVEAFITSQLQKVA
jgi:predicted DNA-binding transcriptional regulator AlpA